MATRYLLVMSDNLQGLPLLTGVIAAEDAPTGVSGEGVVGEGPPAPPAASMAALELLRSLPDAGTARSIEWLTGLAGVTNGGARVVGPWTWDAELRDVIHWAMDRAELTARTVVLVRDGAVRRYPADDS